MNSTPVGGVRGEISHRFALLFYQEQDAVSSSVHDIPS
jgi:hypothetical protein